MYVLNTQFHTGNAQNVSSITMLQLSEAVQLGVNIYHHSHMGRRTLGGDQLNDQVFLNEQ